MEHDFIRRNILNHHSIGRVFVSNRAAPAESGAHLSRRVFAYGLNDTARTSSGLHWSILTTLLPADYAGIDLMVGSGILISRCFDRFSDVMGFIVERTNSKWGKSDMDSLDERAMRQFPSSSSIRYHMVLQQCGLHICSSLQPLRRSTRRQLAVRLAVRDDDALLERA